MTLAKGASIALACAASESAPDAVCWERGPMVWMVVAVDPRVIAIDAQNSAVPHWICPGMLVTSTPGSWA